MPNVHYTDDPQAGVNTDTFYLELTLNGKKALVKSGYSLEFKQTKANRLTVSGTCDQNLTSLTVTVNEKEFTLTVEDGVVSGVIDFTRTEETTTVTSEMTLGYADETTVTLTGDAIGVLLYDKVAGKFIIPENTTYLKEDGNYADFSSGNVLPEDANWTMTAAPHSK